MAGLSPSRLTSGPSRPWRYLIGGSLVLGLLPLIQGVRFVGIWWSERAGEPHARQLASYGKAWGQPIVEAMARELDRVIPPGEALLLTPAGGRDRSGRSRYHLFLARALQPRPVFVRQPKWANGTLVNYPKWFSYHFDLLDTDGSGLTAEAAERRKSKTTKVQSEQRRYGIEWELTYDMDLERPFARSVLTHAGEPVELNIARVELVAEELE